jgi:2,3-bisphosphoglycerate-independent phosphoglycerate mutase
MNMKQNRPRPRKVRNSVVLVILDGWGIAKPGESNAISLARKPNLDNLQEEYGVAQICASGDCVGLSDGQMGNSEVGHLTIGAGRIIFQDLMRVYDEISSGRLAKNKILLESFRRLKKRNGTLHFLGLLSDGGVHSHIKHLFALLQISRDSGVGSIIVHTFLDGRDTPPQSGVKFVASLGDHLDKIGNASIGTIGGRYYAMDRDNRWDRTKLAYDAIVYAEGEKFTDPIAALKKSYENGVNDEFFVPVVNSSYGGVKNGDMALFFNFRPDRARQLTRALTFSASEFGNLFDRRETRRPKNIEMVTMTVYDNKFKNVSALLGMKHVRETLSIVLEKRNVRQIHIAETEKYAHVTYFFNGLVEKPRKFEDRILVPSLKIGTYDQSPEMSARQIALEAVRAIEKGNYGFILVNFANADMVGHSGKIPPTIRAVETVDECLGSLIDAWRKKSENTTMIVTADHGNAEKMLDEITGQPHTAHTSNLVPLVVASTRWKLATNLEKPGLIDVAPSILKILGIAKPRAMTGRPIVEEIK